MQKNKNKKISKLFMIGMLSFTTIFVSGIANANENSYLVNKKVNGSLKEIGEKEEKSYHTKQLKGFAKNLPLVTVMKQITPNGWIVKKKETDSNRLDINKTVSWSGGKTWIETLEDLAYTYSLDVLVDWDNKSITLANYDKKSVFSNQTKKNLFVLENSHEANMVLGNSGQSNNISEDRTRPSSGVWEMSSEMTLRENIEKWAESVGYKVVWNGEDYPVETFQYQGGGFDEESGPIKQISVDYGPQSKVQIPLAFQFYQNKTLVVDNISFEQTEFPQFDKRD